jgi:hypothetical protein
MIFGSFIDWFMRLTLPNQITAHNAWIAPQLTIGYHRPGVCEFFGSAYVALVQF